MNEAAQLTLDPTWRPLPVGTRVFYSGRFGRGIPEEAVIVGHDQEGDELVYLLDLADGSARWGYEAQVEAIEEPAPCAS